MRKVSFVCFVFTCLATMANGQLLQDYSAVANIRHYALDSLRIGGGVVAFDHDNDGLDDLLLTGGELPLMLYRNLGNFNFTQVTASAGLANITVTTYGANAADLDNDGWEDLVISTGEGAFPLLFRNNRDGSFTDVSLESGLHVNQYWNVSVTFADFNKDGFLDIYLGNYAKNPDIPLTGSSAIGAYPNELFLSQGTAFNYRETASEKGVAGEGFTLAVRAMDLDQDHDMDLYIANDFAPVNNERNLYFENDGNGNFEERAVPLGLDLRIFGMGVGLADVNGDLLFDLYLADLTQNHFLLQNESGIFEDITTTSFATGNHVSWGAEFLDVNHDGRYDLFMTNGAVLGNQQQPNLFYENLGGTFLETQFNQVTPPFFSRGWAKTDLDNDGDLDIVATQVTERDTVAAPLLRIYRNTADLRHPERGYLQVKLAAANHNRPAYGSLLYLHLSDGSTQVKMVDNGGAFASKHSSIIHFGLGTATPDSLVVFWPDGQRTSYQGFGAQSFIFIDEIQGLSILRGDAVVTSIPEVLTTAKPTLLPTYTHDHLELSWPGQAGNGYLSLLDVHGRLRMEQPVNFPACHLDLRQKKLLPGYYIAIVSYQGNKWFYKIFFDGKL